MSEAARRRQGHAVDLAEATTRGSPAQSGASRPRRIYVHFCACSTLKVCGLEHMILLALDSACLLVCLAGDGANASAAVAASSRRATRTWRLAGPWSLTRFPGHLF